MSFRLKTIIGIAIIEGTLLAVLILSGLWYISNSSQKEFVDRGDSIARAFAVTAKDAVLSSDIASLESFVKEALSFPGVLYAQIKNEDDLVLAFAGDEIYEKKEFVEDVDFESVSDGVLDKSAEILESGVKFGRVEIGLDIQNLLELTSKAKQYGLSLGLVEMVLVALFSFLLGGYLTRQLSSLEKASNEIAVGNYGYQIDVKGNDELARTANTFNLMSQEIKSSYASLRQSYRDLSYKELYWREVFDSTLDSIIVIDSKGIILSFNRGAELMLGYDNNEVVGKNVSMLIPEPYRSQHDSYLKKYLESGEVHVIGQEREFEIVTKAKARLPISLRVTEMAHKNEFLFIGVIHDISSQKEYQETLKKSLAEKEVLLKEVHHRVKNNMLIVSSILEMQEELTKDRGLIRILHECQDRISSMAMIHQQFYRSDNLSSIDFTYYLDELIERLHIASKTHHQQIDIEKNLDTLSLNVETATPLGLIVNEILSNSFEHAFKDRSDGVISIVMRVDENDNVNLCIRDNGVGLPEGYNLEGGDSLGLQLIRLLSMQLGASLEISGNDGMEVCLTFNESQYRNRI